MGKKKSLLVLILVIAFVLRFYKLGEIPYGFYQDESAIGYNAYSMLTTGKDEHGESFPLYFKSFGDYKLPVYIYLTAFSVKLFGLTELAVRFPSALFSFLTIPIFYLFVLALSKKQNLALIATTLLAINPWHLHYGRATFEVSISLFLFVLGGLLLHKALTTGRKGSFLVGSVCFIASLYSYNLARLLAPVLFALFMLSYRRQGGVIGRTELFATTFASIVLLIPFLVTLLKPGGASSALGTFIFSSAAVQAPLLEFRSYLIDLPILFVKMFFNMFALTFWQYVQNIASYLSVTFFYISGSSHGNHGIGNVGQFYLFELPLIVIGVIRVIRERWGRLLIAWGALVVLVAALTREAPHATRSFFLIAPFITFSALGVLTAWSWMSSVATRRYRLMLIALAAVFVGYSIVYYFISYYVRFPLAFAKAWRSEDKSLSLFISGIERDYEKVVFDNKSGFIYTSLLFYSAFPPSEFHKTAIYTPSDSEGFSSPSQFGKYEFRDIDWAKDATERQTLFVTNTEGKPADVVPIAIFSYPSRPVVISKKQEILQYPVEETAYVVFETE